MNARDFRNEIEVKRPRYLTKYSSMIEAISVKGSTNGGGYMQFGALYQTYMYAFMIGYKLGECNTIVGLGEHTEFFPIGGWKPSSLVNYIIAMILNEPLDKLGFNWVDLDNMSDEEQKSIVANMVGRIEGYANTGLNYLQNKYDNDKDMFRDPFVFVSILRDLGL